jgi:phosphate-selective porin
VGSTRSSIPRTKASRGGAPAGRPRGVFNRVEFEVEREFGDDIEPWRDAWVNVKVHDLLEARGGKFKLPFGLDNSTSSVEHDFIFRSLGTRALAPGRDIGAMIYGEAARRRFTYAIGVFDADDRLVADSERFFDDDQGADSFGRTVSGRVTVQPFDGVASLPSGLRNLEFGASGAWSEVAEGLNSFKGNSVFGYDYFERVWVNGDRVRTGVDVALVSGPASLKAEWINASDERLGQGVDDGDLSNMFTRGWYVSGSWLVTGEDKEDTVSPKRPLLQGGFGAIEVAARYERMLLGSSADASELAFNNPRADNLRRNQDAVVTVGLSCIPQPVAQGAGQRHPRELRRPDPHAARRHGHD